jgi:peptide-methionine (S)-S-oxide reductase
VSYRELLRVFWDSHEPDRLPWSGQYASLILPRDPEQRVQAAESMAGHVARRGAVHTDIVTDAPFWPAEDYHQKYYLQNTPGLVREYRALYPDMDAFVRSTAVARVNGYIGGYGTAVRLERELSRLGLSPDGGARLLALLRRGV